ncbi:uncharacterized protein LOC107047051 [Diachasma alloeum]|nr:uncharacterized protein LOC107047051 [Diachasma alloeum]
MNLKEAINDMKTVTSEQNKYQTGRSKTKVVRLKEFLCTTPMSFDDFEERLKNNAGFSERICEGISHVINAKEMTPTKMITGVLRLLLHKDVLEQFTARKQTKEKRVFKETKLWACICEEIATDCKLYSIPLIKLKDLEAALGHVINNSKDWDMKRKRNKEDETNPKETPDPQEIL